MVVRWIPRWYELDQTIVAGDIDWFYLSKDSLYFASALSGNADCEVKAKIVKITHPQLGDIRGIITIGLDYSIYLSDGNIIVVNAEETPGRFESSEYIVSEWDFEVQIDMIEKTGLTSAERLKMLSPDEIKAERQKRIRGYKALLDLSEADWDY